MQVIAVETDFPEGKAMRINMPVTGIEHNMKAGDTIVSTTDTRGIITHVNDTFVAISGYTRDELVGSPQSLVRHPDMPAEAFKDLWDTIQAERPWVGLVKNRCKNGDHYWVEAHITPIRQGGRTSGFLSVRRQTKRIPGFRVETMLNGRVSQLFEDETLKAAYAEPFKYNRVFDTSPAVLCTCRPAWAILASPAGTGAGDEWEEF